MVELTDLRFVLVAIFSSNLKQRLEVVEVSLSESRSVRALGKHIPFIKAAGIIVSVMDYRKVLDGTVACKKDDLVEEDESNFAVLLRV